MPGLYLFLFGTAVKSTLVTGAAWLGALALRGKSAAVRHTLWSAAFAALLALPLLAATLPGWRLPAAGSQLLPGFMFHANGQVSAREAAPEAGGNGISAATQSETGWLADWPLVLALLWAAGTAVSLTQMLVGWAALERLRRRANHFKMPGFASVSGQLGMEEGVALLENERGSMPITYGVFRPAIFIPGDATDWSEERRQMVLLHELAHVQRGDCLAQLLARITLALYWWNPAVWFAWREFLKERERTADDLVLNAGASASEYASHLLEIARSMQSPAAWGWAAVAMARRSQLEGRLLAILDSGRDRKAPRRAFAMAALMTAVAVIAPVAAVGAKSGPAKTNDISQASSGLVAGLVKKGDAARKQGKYDEAAASYRKALEKLGTRGLEAATVLVRLGTVEVATKNFEGAISDFERAQAVDAGKTGEAKMWMAIAQQQQNNLEAADGLYQSALSSEDPNSAAAATTLELYAALLKQQNRSGEADTTRAEAARIRNMQAAQAASSSPLSNAEVYRIGGDVSAPVLVAKQEPEYTEEARIAKYQGTALLAVEIGVDGLAHNIKIVRALGFGLDEKAIEAIGQWKFKPSSKDGQAVTVAAQVEVNFKLL